MHCAQGLTSLSISGGHLSHKGLDLAVLTSLRKLNTLAVRPHSDEVSRWQLHPLQRFRAACNVCNKHTQDGGLMLRE